MADLHDHGIGPAASRKEMRDQFDRLLRGGQTDPDRRPIGERFQSFQRKRQVRSPLVIRDGMDFIHDHRFDGPENLAAFLRGEQNVQRLRRGHQDVRRTLQHRAPLLHQRVAGAHGRADLRHQQAACAGNLEDFAERLLQVFLNVVAQEPLEEKRTRLASCR